MADDTPNYGSINFGTGEVFIWNKNGTPADQSDDLLVGIGRYGSSVEVRKENWDCLVDLSESDKVSFLQEIDFREINPIPISDVIAQINEQGQLNIAQGERTNNEKPQTENQNGDGGFTSSPSENGDRYNLDRGSDITPHSVVSMPEANIVSDTSNKFYATKTAFDAAREAERSKHTGLAQEYRAEAIGAFHQAKEEDDKAMLAAFGVSMAAPVIGAAALATGVAAAGTAVGGAVLSFLGRKSVQVSLTAFGALSPLSDDVQGGNLTGIAGEGLFRLVGGVLPKGFFASGPKPYGRDADKKLLLFYHGAPKMPKGRLRVDAGGIENDASLAFYGTPNTDWTAFGYMSKPGRSGSGVMGEGLIDLSKYKVLDIRDGSVLRSEFVKFMETSPAELRALGITPGEIANKFPSERGKIFEVFLKEKGLDPDIILMPLGDKWTWGIGEGGTQVAIRSQKALDEIAKTMNWVSN